MNDAQPWNDPKFANETKRYFIGTEHQEFIAGQQNYTKAWEAREIDPKNARILFQNAANYFGKCKMFGLQEKAIDEMNSLLD